MGVGGFRAALRSLGLCRGNFGWCFRHRGLDRRLRFSDYNLAIIRLGRAHAAPTSASVIRAACLDCGDLGIDQIAYAAISAEFGDHGID